MVAVSTEPLTSSLDAMDDQGACLDASTETPLTAEPVPAGEAPLTSELPVAEELSPTSAPALVGACAEPLEA